MRNGFLDNKCNSCHNYHNTSSTEYATFEKTAGSIQQIISRITSTISTEVMPPSDEKQITSAEINKFFDFKDLLSDQSENLEIDLKWTACKFPVFD